MHEKQAVFLIDNVTDGLSLHSVETGHLIRSFPTKPSVPKSKDVAFGEKGAIVVGGGDRGSVYVFDRKQGIQLQKLQHAPEGMVQSVAVRPWQLMKMQGNTQLRPGTRHGDRDHDHCCHVEQCRQPRNFHLEARASQAED